ncbi:DMT family transporter [Dyadobacter tibetensis]|uniref:DMT family transporter n=1 Tax=Dyadobacter tibetensis TaxID=1211851 RepID=UPI000472732A|nr:DMT family transporter [Dyadobacter tibetensis]
MGLHPRISLLIGILCISIFPVLVKWTPVSGVSAAYYRMLIGLLGLLPYALWSRQLSLPPKHLWLPIAICGILFATDISIWNLSIQYSNATQATLLTNLSPIWVGVGAFLFMPNKPKIYFWIGTAVALLGMVVLIGLDTFTEMRFDRGFSLAILSGILYAAYMLVSKRVLNHISIVPFMTYCMAVSSLYLLLTCLYFDLPISGFSSSIWTAFTIQGLICQLLGWLTINFAIQRMDAQRVSLALLSQSIFTALIAYSFINEPITWSMALGGFIILIGIGITFRNARNKV